MWQEISRFGKKLVDTGLVGSYFGNISIREGSKIIITRHNVPLDKITENEVVEVELDSSTDINSTASSETIVHRKIYQMTPALAIIHAHAPFAVIQSLVESRDRIIPVDVAGQLVLHEIPVVRGGIGSFELAVNAGTALKDYKGIIIHGHGSFAAGETLEEAFAITTQVEYSCNIKYYVELAKK
ncbi:MAG: L-fuculose phosphate aldolase [Candidatus Argoarchaeum ethanivorans]|uniref:L-fuculose phosphate aldolase n=1 Tax=Candidatus Argoarchaeum ethanivorans TaxID=2608793 RepID=A0A811T4U1_9EURY|nr:MAG: L-fuculose phosphate aldolase [Candidatus Argoarchaeum ethanivorans]